MEIKLNITITGLEGWSIDWTDSGDVAMVIADVEQETRHAIAHRFGILLSEVEAEAEFESGN